MNFKISALATVIAASMLAPGQVSAETKAMARFTDRVGAIVQDLQSSCKREFASYCKTVHPGQGRMLLCMLAHGDQLSARCGGAVFDALAELGGMVSNAQLAIEACSADIKGTCGKVKAGEGRVAECLIDNKAKISKPCLEAVEVFLHNNP